MELQEQMVRLLHSEPTYQLTVVVVAIKGTPLSHQPLLVVAVEEVVGLELPDLLLQILVVCQPLRRALME